jgi:hypothetical protein
MTKKTRTILFAICVFLFVLTAPSVIFYSQGYRLDFAAKKIVQTGGLYFKVAPRSAQVYVNGKLKDTTSIFTSSSLVENLMPKTYAVEISKDGYYSWQKTLEVKERRVTEAKNITLIPKIPELTKLPATPAEIKSIVAEFTATATSSDGQKVIEADKHEIWISLPEEKEKIFLTRFSETVSKVFWFNDYYLIFNVGDKIKVAEIDDRDRLNIIDIAEFKTPEIFWDSLNGKLYVLSESTLYVSEKLLP